MLSRNDRDVAFFCFCLPARFLVAVLALHASETFLYALAALAILIVAPWIYWLFKPKEKGFFGGVAYWNGLPRFLHIVNYSTFAVLAFAKNEYAFAPLFADFLLAVAVWIASKTR